MQAEDENSLYAYHLLTHTLLSSMRKRLTAVTSKSPTNEFIASIASDVCSDIVGDSDAPLLKMIRALTSSGFRIDVTTSDTSTTWTVACPFAHSLHQNIQGDTVCPTAFLLLGSVMLQKSDERLADQHLTPGGIEFTTKTIFVCDIISTTNP